jgi:copper chaperone CopZ
MKLIKIVCLGLLVSLFTMSCKEASKSEKDAGAEISQSENIKKIELAIVGMTCQIGCAKTIESKLSKTEGISSVAISFEDKLGQIVYDANKISKEDITKKITAIAGGETYSVSSIKVLSDTCCSADLKLCTKKCSTACTKEDCAKCTTAQAECKATCEVKRASCCSVDLKICTKKCSAACTKDDCAKCTAAQAECKATCEVKQASCCASKAKACVKKCSATCVKKECDKCALATAECNTKCNSKK